MIISFLPWILFSLIKGWKGLKIASVIATIAVAIITLKSLKNKNLKILDLGTMVYFLLLTLVVIFYSNPSIAIFAPVMANVALFIISAFSILIKKPFTIQYAKEKVAPEHWSLPIFYSINRTISIVWSVTFVIVSFISYFEFKYHSSILVVMHVVVFVVIVKFSIWYPEHVKKEIAKKTE